jgi:hypothetical protein
LVIYRRAATKPLTTNQIADMVEEHDDSDNDPDYEGQQKKSDSESDMFDMEDEEESAPVTLEAVRRKELPAAEVRVYMEPPVERADGDTDKDSGRIFIKEIYLTCSATVS